MEQVGTYESQIKSLNQEILRLKNEINSKPTTDVDVSVYEIKISELEALIRKLRGENADVLRSLE